MYGGSRVLLSKTQPTFSKKKIMKAYHFEACVFNGDVYCNGCLPNNVTVTQNNVNPIFGSDTWDYYPTCCVCGTIHDYVTLTLRGEHE